MICGNMNSLRTVLSTYDVLVVSHDIGEQRSDRPRTGIGTKMDQHIARKRAG
jgi:hypothetical protein